MKTYLNKSQFLLFRVVIMKKIFALFILILLAGCAQTVVETEDTKESEELMGADCGTVSPDSRDECCASRNKDTIHIMCVGDWKYNLDNAMCEFVCRTEEVKEETKETNVQLANPASTYCVQKGYTLEIRDEAGGQVGYCVFPDGNECEEWRFFREECGEKYR